MVNKWIIKVLLLPMIWHGTSSLPSPSDLVSEALQNQDTFAKKRMDYVCTYTNHILDGSHRSREYEILFFNGYEITRLTAINGKPLSPEQATIEQSKVDQAIKLADKAPPGRVTVMDGGWMLHAAPHLFSQTVEGAIMRNATFDHERRIIYNNRRSIKMDFRGNGNRDFLPKTDEEFVAQAFDGSIVIDEQDRAVVRISGAAMRDAWKGRELLMRQSHILGFDEIRVDDGLYLPLAWVVAPIPNTQRRSYGLENQDFWLKGCRKFHVESHIVP